MNNYYQSRKYLLACAENEGLRAVACIRDNEKPYLVYYFAREAGHYARQLLDSTDQEPTTFGAN